MNFYSIINPLIDWIYEQNDKWNFYSFAILEFILNFRFFWTFRYSNFRYFGIFTSAEFYRYFDFSLFLNFALFYFGSFTISKFYRFSEYSLLSHLSQFSLFQKFALLAFWRVFLFRVGSYEEADETDTYGTFNNVTTNNERPVLRTQSTVDETTQGTYEGFKGSLKGLKLYWSQFLGLLVKRLIYTKRRYLLYGILVSQDSVIFENGFLFWFDFFLFFRFLLIPDFPIFCIFFSISSF